MKAFFQKNWIHFAAVAAMYIISLLYCKPVTEGYGLKQHDIQQWHGMAHEGVEYRTEKGEEALWTNSMFAGMPMMQISMIYAGNVASTISHYYTTLIGRPVDIIFLHMLGFYIFAIVLGMRPLVGMIGAVAMAFASYEIIVIQAGHNAKAMATAFLAPLLATFIATYQRKISLSLIALAGIFMAFEIACNHVQVTYYMAFLLLGLGIYFLVRAIKMKEIKDFTIKTASLIGVFALAGLMNSGNLIMTKDYAKHTIRGGNDVTINPDGTVATKNSSGLDRDYITHWSYGIGETFTLISPNIKGGGSFPIANSQFQPILENSDLSMESQREVGNYGAYWGDQPFTSGPVYLGAIICVLALLALVFWKSPMKWVFLAVSLLAIALSWGKNFMGLTNFFIDYVPGYSMFRTVTIILIIVELCAVALAMYFIDYALKNRDELIAQKNKLFIVLGAIFVFTLVMRSITIDDFQGQAEKEQLANMSSGYYQQIYSMDPEVLKANYGLDVTNKQQVDQFVNAQIDQVKSKIEDLKTVRHEIYKASWTRTAVFTFMTALVLVLFVSVSLSPVLFLGALFVITAFDVIPVAYDYLGSQQDDRGEYKYWVEAGLINYPISTNEADREILAMEVAANPKLGGIIEKAAQQGATKADELGYTGQARTNVIDAAQFSALNKNTSYRVYDQAGGFSSSRASYFHKSIGGYHGAKLRNFQNVVDFHLAYGNNAVLDMLNTKYIIQQGETGFVARVNPNAMGNAWLAKNVRTFQTPNDEIRALGTSFIIKNDGAGQLFVNGQAVKEATVYGAEKIQYLVKGSTDSLKVPLSNGMKEGMEVAFVMDVNGKTDLVMPTVFETEEGRKSFLKLASIKVDQTFDLKDEVVMLESEAKGLKKNYSGEGTVKMTAYEPNRMKYEADLKGDQLVVFSEVYYKDGWKLFVDGQEVPIRKVNYLLRGAEIKGGKHQLEMVFDIPKFRTLNTIAMVGSVILFGLLLVGLFLKWKKGAAK